MGMAKLLSRGIDGVASGGSWEGREAVNTKTFKKLVKRFEKEALKRQKEKGVSEGLEAMLEYWSEEK